jgi:hypothetical protein
MDELDAIRKHLKGTEKEYIECQPHTCQYYDLSYDERGFAWKTCKLADKNLNYWPYVIAPNWCPKRKMH